MLMFPGMLATAAANAGMKVPDDPDGEWDGNDYPHFQVFCNCQLARPMSSSSQHWENAKIIVKVPDEKIKLITLDELIDMGFDAT